MNDRIMIVMSQKQSALELRQFLSTTLSRYKIEMICEYDSMAALTKHNQFAPTVTIVEADMPVLNGFSFVTILRDSGTKSLMYVVVRDDTPFISSQIDYFFHEPLNYNLVAAQLHGVFEKKNMAKGHSGQLEKAKKDQKNLLPAPMSTDAIKVDYIYSPFNELSGDCLDYWVDQDKKGLYGFLFDCTGHDINAFSQVLEIRALFHIHFRNYQRETKRSLSALMKSVNEELFHLHGDNVACCAGVAFYVDFKMLELRYCSAGMPNFFIRRMGDNKYEEIEMENYLIGYDPEAMYDEKSLSLLDIESVIFSSDGFSELLYKPSAALASAKHDDISAVFIGLNKKCVHNGHVKEA